MNKFAKFLETPEGRRHTKVEWGRRLGISAGHVTYLQKGQREPSLHLAWRIEKATGGQVAMQDWLPEHTDDTLPDDAEERIAS